MHGHQRIFVEHSQYHAAVGNSKGLRQRFLRIFGEFQGINQGGEIKLVVLEGKMFGPPEMKVRTSSQSTSCLLKHVRTCIQAGHLESQLSKPFEMNTCAGANVQKSFPRTGFQIALDESPFQSQSLGPTWPLIPLVVMLSTAMIKGALQSNPSLFLIPRCG